MRLAALGLVALVIYTLAVAHLARKGVAEKVETRVGTRYVEAAQKESDRREAAIEKVQVRSQADVQELARLATRIAVLQEEVNRASKHNDGSACLLSDSVLRLAAVR